VDFDSNSWSIDFDTVQQQVCLSGEEPEYCRNGISLGNFFNCSETPFLSFMGWSSKTTENWEGSIGLLSVTDDFCISSISQFPLVTPSDLNCLSLSYPHVNQSEEGYSVWVGCMENWDAGNGEMLHPLKNYLLKDLGSAPLLIESLPIRIDASQCFSRPSLIRSKGIDLMAYSVRGSNDLYRIELLVKVESRSKIMEATFKPMRSHWEDEMVEYPYLFVLDNQIIMFYNGNNFGRTGIGVCEIVINE
jgi:hypothetical protein